MKSSKIIIFIFALTIFSCRKIYVEPSPTEKNQDVFSVSETIISDGDPINIDLKNSGLYTLILFDSSSQQVVIREKFLGKNGKNILNIYTKSLPTKSIYLSLEDSLNNQIGKTLLIIK